MNEKGVAAVGGGFSAVITYRIGGEEKTHFFDPFPSLEDLQTAIIAFKRSLDFSFRNDWGEIGCVTFSSPPSPADV